MNVDLEYDYAEALKRQGHKQTDIDALRSALESCSFVPKSITNKQVRSFFVTKVQIGNFENLKVFETENVQTKKLESKIVF